MAVYASKPSKREMKILKKWLKSHDLNHYKRAQIILMSAAGKKTTEIAQWIGLHPFTIGRYISAFNEQGVSGLEPSPRPGRPSKSNGALKKELLRLLEKSPQECGVQKARWTLQDLAGVLSSPNGLQVSYEWVRQQLEHIRHSFKRSKLRNRSPDPEYLKKKKPSHELSNAYKRTRCCSSGMNRVPGERSTTAATAGPL